MPKLIKDEALVENDWVLVESDTALSDVLALDAARIIVPAELWLTEKDALLASGKEVGVWLDSHEHPSMIKDDIAGLPLIALNFPIFKDGRAYSSAFILRREYNFTGDLRAIGDVLRDQLSYMLSCGFSSFLIPDSVNEEAALHAFHDFRENYQSTVLKPTPLFRRR